MKSLSSNNPIGFGLEEKGVWAKLELFFNNLPAGATVYWVTFSLSSIGDILDKLQKIQSHKKFKLRLICQNTQSKGSTLTISEDTFDQIQKYKDLFVDGTVRAYPLTIDNALFDEDESITKFLAENKNERVKLHAKFIVAETPNGTHPVLVTGSFNFALRSLQSNTESIFISDDAAQAMKALEAAQKIDDFSEDLTKGHCGGRKGTEEESVIIEHPPKDGKSREVLPVDEPATIDKPEELKRLADALDKLLQDYPLDKHCSKQYDIYLSLEKSAKDGRRKDLLYLPVGVGKTFIALRWLIYHLHNVLKHSSDSSAFAVYFTPNEWIERTIKGALELVADKAELDVKQVFKWIRVMRHGGAKGVLPSRERVAAVVADECHNWNPDDSMKWKSGHHPTYTNVLNRWRVGNTPILGLSATPCRIKLMKFNPRSFIEKFIGEPLRKDEDRPFMQLGEAISEGFICKPEYENLLKNKRDEVEKILNGNNGYDLVEFGDYSKVTLRDVWRVLSSSLHELANAIMKAIEKNKSKRVVIFLPPVKNEANKFVKILREELRKNDNSNASGRNNLFDFRSSAASGAAGTDVFNEFQNATKESDPYPPVLVTIDRFQEGVSITDIDMLVMLRATLSPRVAMQALGRGLRLSKGKSKCTVLDAVMFEERVDQWEKSIQIKKKIDDTKHRTNKRQKERVGTKPKKKAKKKSRKGPTRKKKQRSKRTTWTKERIKKLKSLHRKGRTHAEIASTMKLTEGQVHGKVFRLKDKGEL